VALLLPLMGFLFISLLITAIGMSLLRGETGHRAPARRVEPAGLAAGGARGRQRALLNTLKRLAAPHPSRRAKSASSRSA
jgi:hypothetical protein